MPWEFHRSFEGEGEGLQSQWDWEGGIFTVAELGMTLAGGIQNRLDPEPKGFSGALEGWGGVGVLAVNQRGPTAKVFRTQHNTAQHNTTQHNTTQHNTTQHNTTQHNTTQHTAFVFFFLLCVFSPLVLFRFGAGCLLLCCQLLDDTVGRVRWNTLFEVALPAPLPRNVDTPDNIRQVCIAFFALKGLACSGGYGELLPRMEAVWMLSLL